MKALPIALALVGGVVGVLVVRAFFFDPIEELAWRFFWERFGSFSLGRVLESTTFLKSAAGFAVGSFAGGLLGVSLQRKAKASP